MPGILFAELIKTKVRSDLAHRHVLLLYGDSPTTADPTRTRSVRAKPVTHHPRPICETNDGIMTAAIAAPGLRSILPRAKALTACWATHSVRNAVVATSTQFMPKPAYK